MQKIFRILIIIFLFTVCLLLGANLANITLPENKLQSNLEESEESQAQILIFVVDDFDNRKPQLQSIWSVVFYWQDTKGIMFIPLSDQSNTNFEELKKSFLLTAEKDLNDRTIKYFNTKFKTKWNSSIVLDKIALQTLLPWISSGQITAIPNNNAEEIATINSICSLLAINTPYMESLDWASFYATRFKSNLNVDEMTQIWQKIQGSDPLLCEIIQ
jgi:hypothetical protein